MLEEILKLQRSGQLDLAELHCREWLDREPHNADALRLSSMLHFERGNLDQALSMARAAVAAAPDNAEHLAYLGGLEFSNNQPADAETHLREALRLDPNTGSAYLFLGHLALQRNDSASAQENFKSAERVDDNNAQTMAALGKLALQRNDPQLASRYYMRAAELAPDEPSIQVGLGRTFLERRMHAFAERAFENALRINPNLHGARNWLAQTYLEQGQTASAETEFHRLAEVEEYRTFALVGFGDIARHAQRFDDAIQYYRLALEREPRQPVAVLALGWCLSRLGQAGAALQAYQTLLALQPEAIRVRIARAELYSLTRQDAHALIAWQDVLQHSPNEAVALARVPLLLEIHGRLNEASAMAKRCIIRSPQDVDARLVLARAALRLSDGAGALRHLDVLDRATLPAAGQRQLDQHRGFALDQLNRVAEAIPFWLSAQAGLPANGTPGLAPIAADLVTQVTSNNKLQPIANAPIFVLGIPGSGVDFVTNVLLADNLKQLVLRDRFMSSARRDLFTHGEFDRYPNLSEADAEEIREEYFTARATLGLSEDHLIDWLPRWDARFLPAMQRVFPGARIIVVERDPRATLLNWLACGATTGFAFPDLEPVAEWLELAHQHIALCSQTSGISVLRIDADAMQIDPKITLHALLQFLDRASPATEAPFTVPVQPGLPSMLPAHRWRAYRDVLASTFARFDAK